MYEKRHLNCRVRIPIVVENIYSFIKGIGNKKMAI
jgi:hypothetical protein